MQQMIEPSHNVGEDTYRKVNWRQEKLLNVRRELGAVAGRELALAITRGSKALEGNATRIFWRETTCASPRPPA
eukprot:1905973-Rhodomonas_salina.1